MPNRRKRRRARSRPRIRAAQRSCGCAGSQPGLPAATPDPPRRPLNERTAHHHCASTTDAQHPQIRPIAADLAAHDRRANLLLHEPCATRPAAPGRWTSARGCARLPLGGGRPSVGLTPPRPESAGVLAVWCSRSGFGRARPWRRGGPTLISMPASCRLADGTAGGRNRRGLAQAQEAPAGRAARLAVWIGSGRPPQCGSEGVRPPYVRAAWVGLVGAERVVGEWSAGVLELSRPNWPSKRFPPRRPCPLC
jgi:hypothetical protein